MSCPKCGCDCNEDWEEYDGPSEDSLLRMHGPLTEDQAKTQEILIAQAVKGFAAQNAMFNKMLSVEGGIPAKIDGETLWFTRHPLIGESR